MKKMLTALSLLSLIALIGCGQSQGGRGIATGNADGIIGGKVSKPGSMIANTTVAIVDLKRGAACTASILSSSILLTAAHCVHGGRAADYRVVFSTDINDLKAQQRKVSGFKIHAKYLRNMNLEKDTGDIAILRFEGGLPTGFRAAPVLKNSALLKTGASVLLAGYGHDNGVEKTGEGTLRHVVVQIEDAAYSAAEVLVNQRKGKGACQGDSGGPAYIIENGKMALFGVTSRGANDPFNTCGVSGVYTNLVPYKRWIVTAAAALTKAASSAGSSQVTLAAN